MDATQLATITDADVLRGIVVDKLVELAKCDAQLATRDAQIAAHDRTIVDKDNKIAALTAEIARLRRVQFAARSERMDPDQRALFEENMATDIAAVETELDALRSADAVADVTPPRSAPKRRALPPGCHGSRPDTSRRLAIALSAARRWCISAITSAKNSIANRWSSSCGGRCIRNTCAATA